jgi:hypothetical protein
VQAANGPAILSASGQPIKCWGWQDSVVKFGGRQFRWRFLLAAVSFPLLGADFLEHYKLVVDLAKFRVTQQDGYSVQLKSPPIGGSCALLGVRPGAAANCSPTSSSSTSVLPGCSTPSAHPLPGPSTPAAAAAVAVAAAAAAVAAVAAVASSSDGYNELLRRFPAVLNETKQLPEVIHQVEHHIETDGRPVAAKYRRLDPENSPPPSREFAVLERQGIIRRSNSQWSSPLHMVRKPDGSWRPCGDFRRLNLQTKPDRYTCPNIGDLTARLAGCKVFTKLDMRKGYHQIPVRPEDICKTAIVTPFGLNSSECRLV